MEGFKGMLYFNKALDKVTHEGLVQKGRTLRIQGRLGKSDPRLAW